MLQCFCNWAWCRREKKEKRAAYFPAALYLTHSINVLFRGGELHNIPPLGCYTLCHCPGYCWTMKLIHRDKLFIIPTPFYLLSLKGNLECIHVDNAGPDAVWSRSFVLLWAPALTSQTWHVRLIIPYSEWPPQGSVRTHHSFGCAPKPPDLGSLLTWERHNQITTLRLSLLCVWILLKQNP